MTLGLASAHDGSAAFYIDGDGDDNYSMSEADSNACSLGTALNNSFSLFANIRGNDMYAPVGNALGYATARHSGEWSIYAPSTGLFFDIGGKDRYNYKMGKDNEVWSQQDNDTTGVHSLGGDHEQGGLKFE